MRTSGGAVVKVGAACVVVEGAAVVSVLGSSPLWASVRAGWVVAAAGLASALPVEGEGLAAVVCDRSEVCTGVSVLACCVPVVVDGAWLSGTVALRSGVGAWLKPTVALVGASVCGLDGSVITLTVAMVLSDASPEASPLPVCKAAPETYEQGHTHTHTLPHHNTHPHFQGSAQRTACFLTKGLPRNLQRHTCKEDQNGEEKGGAHRVRPGHRARLFASQRHLLSRLPRKIPVGVGLST